jgi:hypothetical protein
MYVIIIPLYEFVYHMCERVCEGIKEIYICRRSMTITEKEDKHRQESVR